MQGKETRGGKPENSINSPTKIDEIVLQPSGEVVVSHDEKAARAPKGKQIHPRRVLPLIPEARPEQGADRQKTDAPDPEDATTRRQEP